MIKFLDFLKESNINVIKLLCNEFGHDQVFSKDLNFNFSNKSIEKAFNILNISLFNNSLPKIPLKLFTKTEAINFLNTRNLNIKYNNLKCYGCYSVIYNIFYNGKNIKQLKNYKITGKEKVNIINPVLFLNISELKNTNFIYAISCLCHEMIHCYDHYYGEYKYLILQSEATKYIINSHSTPTFQKKMKEANNNKINVISELSTEKSFVDLNMNAFKTLTEDQIKNISWIEKDGKYYLDLEKIGPIGELQPISQTVGSFNHLD